MTQYLAWLVCIGLCVYFYVELVYGGGTREIEDGLPFDGRWHRWW